MFDLIAFALLQVAGEIGKVNGISKVLFANSDGYKGFMPGKVESYVNQKYCIFIISCISLRSMPASYAQIVRKHLVALVCSFLLLLNCLVFMFIRMKKTSYYNSFFKTFKAMNRE